MTQQTVAAGRESLADGERQRQRWMHALAMAETDVLAGAWQQWAPKPEVEAIRGPEAGLVMVRSRVDAGGAKFNLGEATVTRATVRLHGEPLAADVLGTAYVLGTDLEHARLAAIFDGLLADDAQRQRVLSEVVTPLEEQQLARDEARRADSRSTLVDFFTVSREHE
ncbi:phosphonate C-P lyase system protein PhnG [Gryllotalpicola reticulitermitis]|uniref:Phosphonate C-P lyase system protein PhnG n=1 Tax=Gryllotalpicola reticulitermitis TaxID=1184153 RepID=A0ABV8QAI6_9MICO